MPSYASSEARDEKAFRQQFGTAGITFEHFLFGVVLAGSFRRDLRFWESGFLPKLANKTELASI
jgi:hypothetical protein